MNSLTRAENASDDGEGEGGVAFMTGGHIGNLDASGANFTLVRNQFNYYQQAAGLTDGRIQTNPGNEGNPLVFNDIFINNQQPLKEGSKVFQGHQKHANGEETPVAIKMIAPFQQKNLREVDLLLTLAPHQNVVKIIRSERCEGPVCPALYIVMELCRSGTVKDYCEKTPFNFNEIMSFCKQLVWGIKHIHDNKIIHGDLKPENILFSLDGKFIKVADFGISKQLRKGISITKRSREGTDSFRAPETFNSDVISRKADIFSLGVTLFYAFTNGSHPFGNDPYLQIYNLKENKNRDFSAIPLQMGVAKKVQLINLLDKMLEFEPEKRPTIDEVVSDVFFTSDRSILHEASLEEANDGESRAQDVETGASKDEGRSIQNDQRKWLRVYGVWFAIVIAVLAVGFASSSTFFGIFGDSFEELEDKPEIELQPDESSTEFFKASDAVPPEFHDQLFGSKGFATNFNDHQKERYITGDVTIRVVDDDDRTSIGALSKVDQGEFLFFGFQNPTPYLESCKFDVNGEMKAVTEMETTSFPGLLGKVETPTSSPGLVIWLNTERKQYFAVYLGDETVKFKPNGGVHLTHLQKGIPVGVHSLDDLEKVLKSSMLVFSSSDIELFEIHAHSTFGYAKFEIFIQYIPQIHGD